MSPFCVQQDTVYVLRDNNIACSLPLESSSFEVLHIVEHCRSFGDIAAYLKDNNGIYWYFSKGWYYGNEPSGKIKKLSTVQSFKLLNDVFATVDKMIFYFGNSLIHVDTVTFTILNPYYAKDQSTVYYYDGPFVFQPIERADAASFFTLSETYDDLQLGIDKNYAYWYFNGTITKVGFERPEVFFQKYPSLQKYILQHPELTGYFWNRSYEKALVTNIRSTHLHISEDAVWIVPPYTINRQLVLVSQADPQTFTALNWHYSKDRHFVFWGNEVLSSADVSTFQVLSQDYGKDRTQVFFRNKILQNANPDHFGIINNTLYTTDNEHVYYADTLLKKADSDTFKVLSLYTAVDKNQVYLKGWNIKGADSKTFRHLFFKDPDDWSVDRHHLYNANGIKTYKNIDGSSFSMLDKNYGLDKNSVFYFGSGRIMKDADVASFELLDDEGKAHDKNYVYKEGKKAK